MERCNRRQPRVSVILLSEQAGDPDVWKEFLLLGGYDSCQDIRQLERIAPGACRRWTRWQQIQIALKQNLERIKS